MASRARLRRFALELARARRGRLAAAVTVALAAVAVPLAGPALLGAVVDAVVGRGETGRIDALALAYLAVVVGAGALGALGTPLTARLGEDVLGELRERTLAHALALPAATAQRAGAGDLLARLTDDVETLTDAVRNAVPEVALGALTVVLTLGALVLVSPLLALGALVAVPVAILSARRYARVSPRLYGAYRDRTATMMGHLEAGIVAAGPLRGLRCERRQLALVRDAADRRLDAERATIGERNRLRAGVSAATYGGLAAVAGLGAALVADDAVTVGAVTAAALYVLRLTEPLGAILEWLDELQRAGAALVRVVGLLDAELNPPGDRDAPTDLTVCARGVRFAYGSTREALRGVDLEIAPGERIAVVGASGAGKTTLARLLAGLEAPTEGAVTIGDAPPDALAPGERARTVALITQEPHLFAASLAANLRLARPGADDERLHAALGAVGAGDLPAMLPAGLDTQIGAGGLPLDPAMTQRVALARVVLADPRVVVLDEATAALAGDRAREAETVLRAALRGRTVIAIAHALDAARSADRVLVMRDGRIVEGGPHERLVAAGGEYARLWRAWAAERGARGPTAAGKLRDAATLAAASRSAHEGA